ncbi:MAG: hypothetical protein R3C52_01905 [Hyphomonadaceae bacterium]
MILRSFYAAVLYTGLALVPATAFAQTGAPVASQADIPRTGDGHPDFQGVWASRWLTPVERPADATALVASPDEAQRLVRLILERAANPAQMDPELAFPEGNSLAKVRGEYRTSLVVEPSDGKLPFRDAGRRALRAYISGADNPEQRMTTERCLGGTGWAPLQIRTASMLRRFVQTDDHVVIHSEAYSDLRIIPIGGAWQPDAIRPPTGDSIAHWEGDALVVDTRNFDEGMATHGIVTVLSPDARITERFEYASPDELVYRYTVNDPAYYSEPWTAEYSFVRTRDEIYEFACHEGNYSLTHMLAAARATDRVALR